MNVEHESVHGWLSGHGAPVSVANVRSRSDLAVASLYAELDRTQPFNDEDEEDDEGQEAALREQLRRVDEQHAGRLNRKMLDAKVSSSKSKSKRARRGVSKSKKRSRVDDDIEEDAPPIIEPPIMLENNEEDERITGRGRSSSFGRRTRCIPHCRCRSRTSTVSPSWRPPNCWQNNTTPPSTHG